MNHEEFENRCLLSIYGELDSKEQAELEQHLLNCSSCKSRVEGLRNMHKLLDDNTQELPEQLLQDSRKQLFSRLRQETNNSRNSFWDSLRESFRIMVNPVPVVSLAAALMVGLFLGYLGFNTSDSVDSTGQLVPSPDEPVRISEVQFKETGTDDGEVELTFSASRRVSIKGQLEDPGIQRVLAHALIREKNTGVRLQAINAMSSKDKGTGDGEIQTALIAALKTDTNSAVRQQALVVLRTFPNNKEITTALIHTLRYDDNVKLRIEAVDALQSQLGTQQYLQEEIRSVLEERMENDSNDYIRNQAKSALQNAGYQYF